MSTAHGSKQCGRYAKIPFSVRMDLDIIEIMEKYRLDHDRMEMSTLIRVAIVYFLRSKGYIE